MSTFVTLSPIDMYVSLMEVKGGPHDGERLLAINLPLSEEGVVWCFNEAVADALLSAIAAFKAEKEGS